MDFIIFNRDYEHSSTYFSNFLNNYKKDRIYTESYFNEINGKRLKQYALKIKKKLKKNFDKIYITNNLEKLLNSSKNELSLYLYNQCFLKENYDENYLKFLIQICNKFSNNYEILFLCRYLIDRCKSHVTLDVLFYNHCLKEIYCSWGSLGDLYKSPLYTRNTLKKYPVYNNIIKNWKDSENDNYRYYMNPEDTVRPILKALSYCVFYDKHKRNFYHEDSDFREDEKMMKIIRQDLKEKYIGNEKWINQFNLYKNTKNIFKDTDIKIIREYSPKFLGLQRLDIYFEFDDKKVAFEYQGKQHYEPIDFFGGVSAFEKRKKLDERKKAKCKRNSINLIEFKYTDSVSTNSIIEKLQKNNIKLKGINYAKNI